MESARKTIRRTSQSQLVLAVALVDKILDETKFFKLLSYLRVRLGAEVILAAISPEYLDPGVVARRMLSGDLARVVYSGSLITLRQDLLDEAGKIAKSSIVLVGSTDLVENYVVLLRKLILWSATFGEDFPQKSECFSVWREKLIPRASGQRLLDDTQAPQLEESYRHVFVTAEGLKRVGGTETLRRDAISFGDFRLGIDDSIWAVDGTYRVDEVPSHQKESLHVPAIIRGFGSTGVLFDIQPTFPFSHSADDELRLPRPVLVARRVTGVLLDGADGEQKKKVVLMSNFNKEKYVGCAIYSLAMQSAKNVFVEVWDDVSSDNSVEKILKACSILNLGQDFIRVRNGKYNLGTYWIRNRLLLDHVNDDCLFFVNDSDDYSSAQRLQIQTSWLVGRGQGTIQIGDTVRVNSDFQMMVVNGDVERYGTASLAFGSSVVNEFGFFEVLKRNADTEFIERFKKFGGSEAFRWDRVPVLFQPFDGDNLTADTHSETGPRQGLTMSSGKRSRHRELFRARHLKISKETLPTSYPFPICNIGKEYAELGSDFLVNGYHERENIAVLSLHSALDVKPLVAAGFFVFEELAIEKWIVHFSGETLSLGGTLQDAVLAASSLWGFDKVVIASVCTNNARATRGRVLPSSLELETAVKFSVDGDSISEEKYILDSTVFG